MKRVYICSAVRTPLGSFGGVLANVNAVSLGGYAIAGALQRAPIAPDLIDEVFMGNVCSANLGQAPARQAALAAQIPNTVPATTINKVCSSGLKAVMLGAQSIQLGLNNVVVAGGMENMSQVPYYLPKQRWGSKYGDTKVIDGLAKDGLSDAYQTCPMGLFADKTAEKYGLTRQAQDEFARNSYERVAQAYRAKLWEAEILPLEIPQRKGPTLLVAQDEEYKKVLFDKIPKLKPVFSPDGTVTAANASTINDGASALVLANAAFVDRYKLTPLAEILAYGDAAHEPEWFTTAPVKASQKVLKQAGYTFEDIAYFEVNEAFAVVTLAYARELELALDKINIFGGAVALGHPIGASGARILTTLTNVLNQKQARLGLATLCNGGGGASAMLIKQV